MRLAGLVALSLASCHDDRPRPSAPRREAPPPAPPQPAPPAAPAPAAPPEPRRVGVEARGVTPWADATPGVRWRKATLRLTPSPSPAHADAAPMTALWVVVRVDVAAASLAVERAPGDSLEALFERERGAAAVFDAGFFEPDHRPSGLVVSRGRPVAPAGPRGGSGVLVVSGGRAEVVASAACDAGALGAGATAVQCGPRVVEGGGDAGVYRHDGRFFARTVACVRDGGRTLDLVATWDAGDGLRGPELYDLATLLAGPSPTGDPAGCEAALNLDGGPSTGVYVRGARGRRAFGHAALGPTPWALVVR